MLFVKKIKITICFFFKFYSLLNRNLKTMKTFTITLQRIVFFAFILAVLSGCATLDKAALRDLDRVPFEPIALQPSFDIYEMRIDIEREKNLERTPDSSYSEEEESYQTLGFYLGNGLFYDLNRNLSLLVPDLFGVGTSDNFIIREFDREAFTERVYRREPDLFNIEYVGLIRWVYRTRLESTDTTLVVNRGLLRKYTLSWTDTTLRHRGLIFSTRILPQPGGFFVPQIIFRRHFFQNGQVIDLENSYRIVNDNNSIVIYKKAWHGGYRPKYTMIRSDYDVYIFNRRQRGYRLAYVGNELIVFQNRREIKRYVLQQ
jgi:hypothetical protein